MSAPLQVPQVSVPPQVSLTVPQVFPNWVHVVGTQAPWPQALAVPPPPHTSPPVQVPQSSTALQPSLTRPQSFPNWPQVVGAQVPVAQTFSWPPAPQLSPATSQAPQVSVPPQPSSTVPQFFPSAAQLVGRQVLVGVHWPNWHVAVRAQAEQSEPAAPQDWVDGA